MPGAYYETDLPDPAKNLHRAILSLEEELEAVNAYNQRMSATQDAELRALLEHNRNEEIEHASMLMEWLRRRMPEFDRELKTYLFTPGSITGAEAKTAPDDAPAGDGPAADGSLGIGSMRRTDCDGTDCDCTD